MAKQIPQVNDQFTDHEPETPNFTPPKSFQKRFKWGFFLFCVIVLIGVLKFVFKFP